ncbi:MAG: hypothetical protein ACR2HD_01315 [Solirubrobacteraceae bacterium]|nr:MAG: hypothetical protein DLM63_04455 [Solirubrobacterales bacterium]
MLSRFYAAVRTAARAQAYVEDLRSHRIRLASVSSSGDGPSDHPPTGYLGNLLMFDSLASNLAQPGGSFADTNNASDIFLWGDKDRLVKLRSIPCNTGCHPLNGASSDPVTSYVDNYTLFYRNGQL